MRETDKAMSKLLLYIQGGLGKVIMSTAVVRNLKENNPNIEIIVVSGYPEVFFNNPHVSKTLSFSTPYLWKDLLSKNDVEVSCAEPYHSHEWIKDRGQRHLISIWTRMIDPDAKIKHNYPELYFSGPEVEELQRMITTEKPLLIVQSTGGSDPAGTDWTRNPPQEELEKYLGKFMDTHFIGHLAVPGTPPLENIHQRIEGLSTRQAMCLVYHCPKFIGIDSFGLHTRAAKGVKSETDIFLPLQKNIIKISYDIVNNITPCDTVQELIEQAPLYHSTLFKHPIQSPAETCPVPAGQKWFEV